MTTAILDIYNLLIEAGIDAKKAKPLAEEIVTREEAPKVRRKRNTGRRTTQNGSSLPLLA